jgi:Methyltransferase FkbM domain
LFYIYIRSICLYIFGVDSCIILQFYCCHFIVLYAPHLPYSAKHSNSHNSDRTSQQAYDTMVDVLSLMLKKHRHRIGLIYFGAGLCMGLVPWLFGFGASSDAASSSETVGTSVSVRGSVGSSSFDRGWSTIHVFYGNTSHIQDNSWIDNRYFGAVKWFSQARQDEAIATLLKYKKGGYFIDLAANDAVKISNTYALETYYGWKGLCMEPNPAYWAGLAYRKCDVVGAVVGHEEMDEVWFKFPSPKKGPLGGIVGFDNKEKTTDDRPRYTQTLLNIFQKFDTPKVIDYLSLDVEGAEDLIMKDFPFHKYRFNLITLERPSDEMKARLETYGYKMWKYVKLNTQESLWYHKSVESELDLAAAEQIDTTCVYREAYAENHPNCQLKGPLPELEGRR